MRWEHFFTSHTKINSQWITNLNLKHQTVKFLEGSIGRALFDINHSDIFLDISPKAKEIKVKINKWDLIKLRCFCTAKETINKMKRQPAGWEEIFANDMFDRGLIFKIYKKLIPHNIKSKQTIWLKLNRRT